MSNPIIDMWNQASGIQLPPIGQVDPEEEENPIIRAWEASKVGTGRSLLTQAQTQEERIAGTLAILGSVGHGIIKPISGLLGFPGAAGRGLGMIGETDKIITDRMAETINHWNSASRDRWETRARDLGFSEEEMRGTRMLGEVVGFMAPGLGVYKGVSRALGVTAEGIAAAPFMAGLKVDVVSGMVWGGVMTEGEISDRFKSAAIDGGLSGAIGLALTGAWPAIAAYRNTRLVYNEIDKLHDEGKRNLLKKIYEAKRRGELGPLIDIEGIPEGRALFDLMSEESLFINSPAAQRMLVQSANESALIAAAIDVQGARATGGLVRQVGHTLQEASELVEKFKGEFPTLRMEALKNPGGGFDIYFGAKGLNNTQRGRYAVEGRYPGQRLQHIDGPEYEYIGPHTREGWLRVKRLDTGSETKVKAKNVNDTPFGVEPGLRTPQSDALFKNFDEFFRTRSAQVLNERYSLSETDLVRLARRGELGEEILRRRRVNEPNAVTQLEEAGAERIVAAGYEMPDGRRLAGPSHPDAVLDNEAILRPNEIDTLDALISGDITPGSPDAPLEGFFTNTGRFVSREEAAMIAQNNNQLAPGATTGNDLHSMDLITDYAVVKQTILREGTESVWIAHPWENIDFEDAFRLWAQERGLASEGAEFISMQTDFAARMRSTLLQRFNAEFPEEAAVLQAMRDEWAAIINADGMPLEARAAVKGFHLDQLSDGSVRLRDMNSGAAFNFANRRSAEAVLPRVVRGDRGLGDFGLPPDLIQQVMSPNAVKRTPIEEIIADALPGNALSEAIAKEIPTRISTNTRDLFIKFEDRTQIPLWRMGVQKIDEGSVTALHEYMPWGRALDKAFNGNGIKSRNDGVRLGEYLVRTEGEGIRRGSRLTPSERYAVAKEMGLSQEDLRAIKEYRRNMDAGFEAYGLPREDYIEDYFGRILPFVQEHGSLPQEALTRLFPNGVPAHLKWSAEFHRTGNMPVFEMDVRIVAHKWFKNAAFKRNLEEPWEFLAKATRMQVRDLPTEARERLRKGSGRQTLVDTETVLPEPLNDILKEYLNSVRGAPTSSVKGVQNVFSKIYKKLGINVDERVSTEFFNIALSTMYGAAMGARPMLLARNHLQTTWNLYVRLGSKHFNASMGDAITPAGYKHAMEALAIRGGPTTALPLHDHLFEEIVSVGAMAEKDWARPLAWAMNKSLAAGKISRGFAEKTLIPYGSGDAFSRAWAFHYQRRHTADALQRMKLKKISTDKFLEDGLPFYDRAVREEFMQRLRYQGEANALDFIGKMAADETHFIYGTGMQPAWMQNPFGKFAGMFGTWPLWQKEVYSRIMRNGTPLQKTAAGMRTAAIGGALGLVGYSVGVNMWNWLAPAFWQWSGGPGVDYAIGLKQVLDAPIDQKANALGQLARQVPRLSFPGQILLTDLQASAAATDDPALQALYLMLGRPTEASYMDIVLHDWPLTGPGAKHVSDAAPTSASVPSAPFVGEFGINLESLGLAPSFGGDRAENFSQRTPYAEIIEYLGGNIPR